MHPATRDPRCRREKRESRCSKKERKEKEEEKKKEETHHPGRPTRGDPPRWVSPAVGLRDPSLFRQRVCSGGGGGGFRFESRFFSIGSGCRKDLAVALSQPPRSKSTTGHRDPRLGLAGRGFGFFFFFFPSGGSDFFFFLFLG
jgi:hypothetical protein